MISMMKLDRRVILSLTLKLWERGDLPTFRLGYDAGELAPVVTDSHAVRMEAAVLAQNGSEQLIIVIDTPVSIDIGFGTFSMAEQDEPTSRAPSAAHK